MTKEEIKSYKSYYKDNMCKRCINQQCNMNITIYKDELNVVHCKCNNYRSIFMCGQLNCNSCGKCK